MTFERFVTQKQESYARFAQKQEEASKRAIKWITDLMVEVARFEWDKRAQTKSLSDVVSIVRRSLTSLASFAGFSNGLRPLSLEDAIRSLRSSGLDFPPTVDRAISSLLSVDLQTLASGAKATRSDFYRVTEIVNFVYTAALYHYKLFTGQKVKDYLRKQLQDIRDNPRVSDGYYYAMLHVARHVGAVSKEEYASAFPQL